MTINYSTRISSDQLRAAINRLPSLLASRNRNDVNTAFGNHFAHAFFTRVQKNFEDKSDGGSDEFGNRWKPLDRKTIAYRPLGKEELRRIRIAEQTGRGLLTPAQNRIWKGIFASRLKKLILQTDMEKAKVLAAKSAWAILKSRGAQTKIGLLGGRKVPILRVSDRLFKSVSAGTLAGNRYYKPKEQVCEIEGGKLTFGTTVPYAGRQSKRRPIFPSQRNMAASGMLKECVTKAVKGCIEVFQSKYR